MCFNEVKTSYFHYSLDCEEVQYIYFIELVDSEKINCFLLFFHPFLFLHERGIFPNLLFTYLFIYFLFIYLVIIVFLL